MFSCLWIRTSCTPTLGHLWPFSCLEGPTAMADFGWARKACACTAGQVPSLLQKPFDKGQNLPNHSSKAHHGVALAAGAVHPNLIFRISGQSGSDPKCGPPGRCEKKGLLKGGWILAKIHAGNPKIGAGRLSVQKDYVEREQSTSPSSIQLIAVVGSEKQYPSH